MPGLKLSVSYTTRKPRKGEKNDVDYTFIDRARFRKMIAGGEFAEWAMVHGNLYGTSLKRLRKLNKEGYDIILDIDIHGAMQMKKTYENTVYIFILPPSIDDLKKRLFSRSTDAEDVIKNRLDNAKAEIAYYSEYDYIIVNDTLEKAYRELESVIINSRLRVSRVDPKLMKKVYKLN